MRIWHKRRAFRPERSYSARFGIRSRRQRREAARLGAAGATLICLVAACCWWAAGSGTSAALADPGNELAAGGDVRVGQSDDQVSRSVNRILARVQAAGTTFVPSQVIHSSDDFALTEGPDGEPVPIDLATYAEPDDPLGLESMQTVSGDGSMDEGIF